MQADMEKTQTQLTQMEFTATAGGGAVTAVVTGAKVIKSLKIKPEVVDPDDVEMLEDLVLTCLMMHLIKLIINNLNKWANSIFQD